MIPYTDKAKKALNYANRLSRSSGCNYVGTEHILAGLLKEGTGVAAEVLTANNVELEALLKLIDELVAAGEEVTVADRDGYSPRTQMVLDRAREMADRFDSERIGTEHLLLAIIKEGDCAASRLLNTMGANPQKLFVDILAAMQSSLFRKTSSRAAAQNRSECVMAMAPRPDQAGEPCGAKVAAPKNRQAAPCAGSMP